MKNDTTPHQDMVDAFSISMLYALKDKYPLPTDKTIVMNRTTRRELERRNQNGITFKTELTSSFDSIAGIPLIEDPLMADGEAIILDRSITRPDFPQWRVSAAECFGYKAKPVEKEPETAPKTPGEWDFLYGQDLFNELVMNLVLYHLGLLCLYFPFSHLLHRKCGTIDLLSIFLNYVLLIFLTLRRYERKGSPTK